MEQDPGFAFRIMVDIAARALSPAINDPTTAVLALIRSIVSCDTSASKQLESAESVMDRANCGCSLPPQWEDFVTLAVNEIRLFGAGSLQIPRRLQALLEHLIAVLPDTRGHALRQELILLHRAVAAGYLEAEDRRRAATSDRQGIGGSSGPTQGRRLRASGAAGEVRANLVRPDTRIPDGPYTCCFVVCRHLVSWYAASLGSRPKESSP